MTHDVIIIGAGPAGLTAGIYSLRAGKSVLCLDSGGGSLKRAHSVENYFGFAEPLSGEELLSRGKSQFKRLGGELSFAEATAFTHGEPIEVVTSGGVFTSSSLVIAAGAPQQAPNITGLVRLEGKGVSFCAVCDAFFFRGKDVAVIGSGEFAKHEAEVLVKTSKSVKIFTNGEQAAADFKNFEVNTDKIREITGESKVSGIITESESESHKVEGVFVALGTASGADFARRAGITTVGTSIKVDEAMRTNLRGVYACGDCTGGLKQIAKAVHEGAVAALSAVK
jgi:thioredoxin reductase (NADPH)